MSLTFKQLEAFYFSAKLASFSAAALKLHATQSAISKRVAEFEDAVGTPVLHRTSRGLELSLAGRRLLPLAEEAQRLRFRIEKELRADGVLRGTFRIGVTELIGLTWLTPLIQQLQHLHPEMTLEPVVDVGMTLFESLRSNRIDVAIMPGTYWGSDYVAVKVAEVDDPWVASPDLTMPSRPLRPHEFVLYPVLEQSGAAKNRVYDAWRAEHGFKFGKILSTNSSSVLRELAISGFGVTQLVLDYVRPDIEAGRLRIVESDPMPPPMIYCAVYHEDNTSVALEEIVRVAIDTCDFSLRGSALNDRVCNKQAGRFSQTYP